MCDIFVFFKVFYFFGYGVFRLCLYCWEVGYWCKYLSKIIYLLNWRFLDFNYFLWCEEGFGEGGLDNKEKLVVYFNEEEFLFCE